MKLSKEQVTVAKTVRDRGSSVRALRRVATRMGVQAQHDWFEVRVPLGGKARTIQALLGTLSHSRARFCWVS